MYEKASRDHDQAGHERADARSNKETPSGANSDDDEHDLQPFEHSALKPASPASQSSRVSR